MRARRLFGVETEYAVAGFGCDGSAWPRRALLERVFDAARRIVHLPDTGGKGLFLANGTRFYLDYGDHPEICSPECLNPWDVVRYSKAGDRILTRLVEGVQREEPALAEVIVLKSNVDYSVPEATWGAHESYCHRANPAAIQRGLIPHLVSRIVYTGAGGFDPYSRGLDFMLSPRTRHIACVISNESIKDRGIIHTRHESLALDGYYRQHVLCGESVRSDLAAWLRVGTTALVVAMIEAGIPCGDDVALGSPLQALGTIARDVSVRRTVETNGGELTAIQIQQRYLDRACEHLDASWMPSWAEDVCSAWDRILTRLERGPEAVGTTLDWAIKLSIYRDHARRRGFDWNRLPASSRVADLFGPPEDLDRFPALQQEMFEADVRFGQLGGCSVFEALDRQGVLDHAVPGVDRIDEAMEQPPEEGRARLRGLAIKQAARAHGRYACCWEYVINNETQAYLDLRDPFIESQKWKMPPVAPPPTERAEQAAFAGLRDRVQPGRLESEPGERIG